MMKRVMRLPIGIFPPATSVARKILRVSCAESVSFRSVILISLPFMILLSAPAPAMVFINEVFFNPPESDELNEYIELMGTPGMKLTGYAIAVLNGTEYKYWYPAGTNPPLYEPDLDVYPNDPNMWSVENPARILI